MLPDTHLVIHKGNLLPQPFFRYLELELEVLVREDGVVVLVDLGFYAELVYSPDAVCEC